MTSALTRSRKSFLAAEVTSEYLAIQEGQLKEIKKGIAEANNDQMINHSIIVKYWKKKYAHLLEKTS